MLPTGSQRYILLYCGGCVSYHRRAKIGLKSDDSSSNGELPHAQLYYTCKWFTLAIAFFTFYTTILHSFLCKNDIKNQRIIKHHHRRNVTSHHFFTLLSQFLFLWLFLHLTGATPFHRKEWSQEGPNIGSANIRRTNIGRPNSNLGRTKIWKDQIQEEQIQEAQIQEEQKQESQI